MICLNCTFSQFNNKDIILFISLGDMYRYSHNIILLWEKAEHIHGGGHAAFFFFWRLHTLFKFKTE